MSMIEVANIEQAALGRHINEVVDDPIGGLDVCGLVFSKGIAVELCSTYIDPLLGHRR